MSAFHPKRTFVNPDLRFSSLLVVALMMLLILHTY
jgi:hypothetical protein